MLYYYCFLTLLQIFIRKIKANHKLLKFNGTHQVVIYGDDVNLWVKAYTPKASSVHCTETGRELNVEKAQNIFLFHEQHAAQNIFLFYEQHAAQNIFLFHEQHAAQKHNT